MKCYARSTVVHTYKQASHGYLELKERDFEYDKRVAQLALALCATDGHIDKRETAIVKGFFAQRLAGRQSDEDHRDRLNRMLSETMGGLQRDALDPDMMIAKLCDRIVGFDDPALAQTAYDLCVRVVAADDAVQDAERQSLSDVADRLNLPDNLVRETHDRYFRASMYQHDADEALVDMPDGLSDSGKIEFLNREYRKWRGRVTHADPKVRSDASMRLEAITKLRRKLSDEQASQLC